MKMSESELSEYTANQIKKAKLEWHYQFGNVEPIETLDFDSSNRVFVLTQRNTIGNIEINPNNLHESFRDASDLEMRDFDVLNEGFSVMWESLDLYFTINDLLLHSVGGSK